MDATDLGHLHHIRVYDPGRDGGCGGIEIICKGCGLRDIPQCGEFYSIPGQRVAWCVDCARKLPHYAFTLPESVTFDDCVSGFVTFRLEAAAREFSQASDKTKAVKDAQMLLAACVEREKDSGVAKGARGGADTGEIARSGVSP